MATVATLKRVHDDFIWGDLLYQEGDFLPNSKSNQDKNDQRDKELPVIALSVLEYHPSTDRVVAFCCPGLNSLYMMQVDAFHMLFCYVMHYTFEPAQRYGQLPDHLQRVWDLPRAIADDLLKGEGLPPVLLRALQSYSEIVFFSNSSGKPKTDVTQCVACTTPTSATHDGNLTVCLNGEPVSYVHDLRYLSQDLGPGRQAQSGYYQRSVAESCTLRMLLYHDLYHFWYKTLHELKDLHRYGMDLQTALRSHLSDRYWIRYVECIDGVCSVTNATTTWRAPPRPTYTTQ